MPKAGLFQAYQRLTPTTTDFSANVRDIFGKAVAIEEGKRAKEEAQKQANAKALEDFAKTMGESAMILPSNRDNLDAKLLLFSNTLMQQSENLRNKANQAVSMGRMEEANLYRSQFASVQNQIKTFNEHQKLIASNIAEINKDAANVSALTLSFLKDFSNLNGNLAGAGIDESGNITMLLENPEYEIVDGVLQEKKDEKGNVIKRIETKKLSDIVGTIDRLNKVDQTDLVKKVVGNIGENKKGNYANLRNREYQKWDDKTDGAIAEKYFLDLDDKTFAVLSYDMGLNPNRKTSNFSIEERKAVADRLVPKVKEGYDEYDISKLDTSLMNAETSRRKLNLEIAKWNAKEMKPSEVKGRIQMSKMRPEMLIGEGAYDAKEGWYEINDVKLVNGKFEIYDEKGLRTVVDPRNDNAYYQTLLGGGWQEVLNAKYPTFQGRLVTGETQTYLKTKAKTLNEAIEHMLNQPEFNAKTQTGGSKTKIQKGGEQGSGDDILKN